MKADFEKSTIEGNLDISTYLDRLKYALESGSATINFQRDRQVDRVRDAKYTNRHTIVEKMHDEEAYKCTDSRCIIPYSFAARLSID